jgi:hypothetical protein
MKSENILSNILSKKNYIAFERKIAQKKTLLATQGTYVAFLVCLKEKLAEIPCISNVRISSSLCSGPPKFGPTLVSAKADTDQG